MDALAILRCAQLLFHGAKRTPISVEGTECLKKSLICPILIILAIFKRLLESFEIRRQLSHYDCSLLLFACR